MKPLHRDEKIGVILCLVVALWVITRFAIPGSIWFSVNSIKVNDAATWQEVTVDLDRDIKRDFLGEWSAKIRRKEPQGWVTVATTPVSQLTYQVDSKLPEPVTLEWLLWTEPKAYQLPCGVYDGTVQWVINSDSLVLRRSVIRNIAFTIWGNGECTL